MGLKKGAAKREENQFYPWALGEAESSARSGSKGAGSEARSGGGAASSWCHRGWEDAGVHPGHIPAANCRLPCFLEDSNESSFTTGILVHPRVGVVSRCLLRMLCILIPDPTGEPSLKRSD